MKVFKMILKSIHGMVWISVTAVLLAILIVTTVLATTTFRSILGTVLGGPIPIMADGVEPIYTSDYGSKAASKAAGDELNVDIATEGFTLLLNENNALPLAQNERKVSVFGKNSVDLVLSGSGSGSGGGEDTVTIYDGLVAAGIEYNPDLREFYESGSSGSGRSNNPAITTGASKAPTLDIGETPVKSYSSSLTSTFNEYNDAAIVVISRIGGESFDLPRTQNTSNGGIEGNHYLQLDQNEYDMLDMVTSRFQKVIVVLNTLTSFQCNFIYEYNNMPSRPRIDAVVWIGGPGTTGATAIGDLLTGKTNFSGKTTDIYARDFTKDPTWQNFGDNTQVNDGKSGSSYIEGQAETGNYFISYEEGIYVGYRYYETRGYEESKYDANIDWYGQNVIFPFGYGLSYTTFEQTMTMSGELKDGESLLSFSVTVKNTGNTPGKDIVQLYVTLPYYDGGIEKSRVQLVDFAKTRLLDEGESQTINFTVDAYDLASYDYNDANGNGATGYELDAGDYIFYAAANSHVDGEGNVYATATAHLDNAVVYTEDPVTHKPVGNLYTFGENYNGVEADNSINFNDLQYRLEDVYVKDMSGEEVVRKGMSRTDFEGTFPNAPTKEDRTYFVGEKAALDNREHNNTEIENVTVLPTTGADGELTLRDLIGADYDDARWEQLLDRLTTSEMLSLVNNGAFQTAAIVKIKKNLTNDSDGPVGFVNFMQGLSEHYKGNTVFACQVLIAATWNKDLAYRMGKIVGDNGVWGDTNGNQLPYTGWYAPGINLHRSPFAGRNFEYYSEDPVLSGKLAVNVVNGAAQKGVYTDLKHFALNEQETNRSGVSTFCTEQSLRELYIKPFEIAVKGDDSVAYSEAAQNDNITDYIGSRGVMSSFNRIGVRWTGGDYRLMTRILRDEWGFKGLVISDYKTDNSLMDARQMVYAGNDLILTSLENCMWRDCDSKNPQDMQVLRTAAHNILYAVANSNSMNGDVVAYKMEWWVAVIISVDCVVPAALAVWGYFVIRGVLKKCKLKADSIEGNGTVLDGNSQEASINNTDKE